MNKKDIRYIQAILNGMDNNAHAESDEIKEFTKRVLNAFSIQSDTQKAFAHTSGQGTTNTTQFDAVELPDDLQDPMEIVRRGKITTFQSDAVEFAEWLVKNNWVSRDANIWENYFIENRASTKELYNIFNQLKK